MTKPSASKPVAPKIKNKTKSKPTTEAAGSSGSRGKPSAETTYSVFCCQGGDCVKAGAKEVLKEIRGEIRAEGLKRRTHIVKTQCSGLCKHGPVVAVFAEQPQGVQPLVWYGKLKLKDARRIVDEHLKKGEVVEDKLLNSG